MQAKELLAILEGNKHTIKEVAEEFIVNSQLCLCYEDFIEAINRYDEAICTYSLDLCNRDFPLNYGTAGLDLAFKNKRFKQVKVFINRIVENQVIVTNPTEQAIREFGINR